MALKGLRVFIYPSVCAKLCIKDQAAFPLELKGYSFQILRPNPPLNFAFQLTDWALKAGFENEGNAVKN